MFGTRIRRRLRAGVAGLAMTGLLLPSTSCSEELPLDPALIEIPSEPAAHAKNVMLIVVDTLRADHLGTYGFERPTSPNLDALAAKSTVFERMYSHAPWTMPSMASYMTSLTPRDHGVFKWTHHLDEQFPTLAEALQTAGFHTMAVVSHIIFEREYGFAQGFDHYDRTVLDMGHPHKVISSEAVTDKAIEALKARPSDQPFFLWTHYFDPHADYIKHEAYDFGDEKVDRYDSEIRYTDEHIGRLLDYMESEGLMEDTVIAFVSDHGEEFKEHGHIGHTRTLFDELIRVPFIVYAPGLEPARNDEVVGGIDVAPTLLRLVGVRPPNGFDGQVIEIEDGAFAPQPGRAVISETRRSGNLRGVTHGEFKFVRDHKNDRSRLYHLPTDRREKRNVASSNPDELHALALRIRRYYRAPTVVLKERKLSSAMTRKLKGLGYLGGG
jgi:arylsulfatase A-like enzyme